MATKRDLVEITRDFITQVQEQGRKEVFDDYVHPDFKDHPLHGVPSVGRDMALKMMEGMHAALEDISVEVIHCFEHNGVVATHKIVRAKHVGTLYGQPPDGKRVEIRVMDFVRFQDGKMIEHWATFQKFEKKSD